MTEIHRIEIGLIGDQVIALKLGGEQLASLRKSLPSGGWQTVVTEDGEIDIDLAKVAFLRVASGAHSVGFGQGSA